MANFEIIHQIGESGSGDNQFSNPKAVYIHGEFMYVVDAGNSRLLKMSMSGNFVAKKTGLVGLNDLIIFNNVVVTFNAGQLKFFDLNLSQEIGTQTLSGISGVDSLGDYLFVVNNNGKELRRYDKQGSFDVSVSLQGSTDTYGHVWVSDVTDCSYVCNDSGDTIEVYATAGKMEHITTITGLALTDLQDVVSDGVFMYAIESSKITAFNIGDNSLIASNTFVGKNYSSGFYHKPWIFLVDYINNKIDIINVYDHLAGLTPDDEFGIADTKPTIVGGRQVISEDTTSDNSFVQGATKTDYSIRWKQ